jgi:Tfp pilus assembly PilM family ATPase
VRAVRRTGIDLSYKRCNLVDVESSARGRDGSAIRVRHFASLPHAENNQALVAELKALLERKTFPRRAWVNLWDVRSSHQYLLLPAVGAADLKSMAHYHAASMLGLDVSEVTIETIVGKTRGEPARPKTEVSFFAAGTQDVRHRLRPFEEAGFFVEGVTTPCGALWAQSRLRWPALPHEVHAHVAIGASQIAVGIFSNDALLYARDFDWGYALSAAGVPLSTDRELLGRNLASELRRSFLYLKQYWEEEVSLVLLCGDMTELRSLTAPLIEQLNIEVETLDTLEGIDIASLPDDFAERATTFRLALSVAVAPPPVNLLPVEIAAGRSSNRSKRVYIGGAAAAAAIAALLYASLPSDQSDRPIPERAALEPVEQRPAARSPVTAPPSAPSQSRVAAPPGPAAPADVRPLAAANRTLQDPIINLAAEMPVTRSRPRVQRRVLAPLVPPPVVTSILISGDRRVARIDGRVVGVGDRVGFDVVESIEPGVVVFVTDNGDRRRVALDQPSAGVVRR